MLNINVGIVILVGSAARLVINTIVMANTAKNSKYKLIPVMATNRTVNGVSTQPCRPIAVPSQKKRFSSWFSHHCKNLVSNMGLDDLSDIVPVNDWLNVVVDIFFIFCSVKLVSIVQE